MPQTRQHEVGERREKFFKNLKGGKYPNYDSIVYKNNGSSATFGQDKWKQTRPENTHQHVHPNPTINKIRNIINRANNKQLENSEIDKAREGYRTRQNSDREILHD